MSCRSLPVAFAAVITPGEPTSYHELADLLRDEITSGRLGPGAVVPSEKTLEQTYGLSRITVRRAVEVLANEGLIVVRHGYRTRVREQPERERVRIPRGAMLTLRMPTSGEREAFGIGVGVPVAEVVFGGKVTVYPGDRYVFTTA
jgi:DNA-binding transcriptional MocR family regulator